MDFLNLPTTRRGLIGEQIVDDYLKAKGCHLYQPGEGSHPIDRFMIDPTGRAFAYDVKTYPRLYSCDKTGIDLADYRKYLSLDPVPVLLFFVDPFECCLYVYRMNRKDGHRAPMIEDGKAFFYLSEMTVCRSLTVGEVSRLGGVNEPARYSGTRSYFSNLKTGSREN